MITVADALKLTDAIAMQALNIQQSGYESVLDSYDNNRNTIIDATTNDDMSPAVDLSAAFQFDIVANLGPPFDGRRAALTKHLGDLNAYATKNNIRFAPELKQILSWPLQPANMFSYQITLGDVVVTASDTGTFTDGEAADTTKYSGKLWVNCQVTSDMGAAPLQVNAIGTKWDGSAQTHTVTIPAGSTPGFLVPLGVFGSDADSYKDITNVVLTGGTAGDTFNFLSVPERQPLL